MGFFSNKQADKISANVTRKLAEQKKPAKSTPAKLPWTGPEASLKAGKGKRR